MFHKSQLEGFVHRFPHDITGYVPTRGDCWRQMRFDHADQDPDEPGISEKERARRIEYLDTVWWPEVLAKVEAERRRLERQHATDFIQRWEAVANQAPPAPHGFEVE